MLIDSLRYIWVMCVLMALILLLILGPYLPLPMGWESGPLKIFQALVLFVGGSVSFYMMFRPEPDITFSLSNAVPPSLLAVMTFVWWSLCLYKLSWGAVFFPPLGFDSVKGYAYSAPLQLPYYNTLLIGYILVAVLSLVTVIHHRRYLAAYFESHRLPLPELLGAFFLQLLAMTADAHLLSLSVAWSYVGIPPQIAKQWCELLSYATLFVGQLLFLFKSRY